jgi:hypothetical protein
MSSALLAGLPDLLVFALLSSLAVYIDNSRSKLVDKVRGFPAFAGNKEFTTLEYVSGGCQGWDSCGTRFKQVETGETHRIFAVPVKYAWYFCQE